MWFEKISIRQAINILGKYDHILFGPEGFDFSETLDLYDSSGVRVSTETFEDHYFKSAGTYNKLMLSPHFYERFTRYSFLLIYQTDAFVFRDDLSDWIIKNYDYTGAPWINNRWSTHAAGFVSFPRRLAARLGYSRFNMVGNGGLSLRKTKACYKNLLRYKSAASQFTKNEDYFFSFYLNSYNPFFKVAPVKEAIKFSFDEHPELAFEKNGCQLPMGCHAWQKTIAFWKPILVRQAGIAEEAFLVANE